MQAVGMSFEAPLGRLLTDIHVATYYGNSSSSSTSSAYVNKYCMCTITIATNDIIFYNEIFSSKAGTMVYTIDTGTNKTIGSSLSLDPFTSIDYESILEDQGWGEVVTVTTLEANVDPS